MNNTRALLTVTVENRDLELLSEAAVTLISQDEALQISLPSGPGAGTYASDGVPLGQYKLTVQQEGYLDESYPIELGPGQNSRRVVLGREGEPFYWADGIKIYFEPVYDRFLIAARGANVPSAIDEALDVEGLSRQPSSDADDLNTGGAFVVVDLPASASVDSVAEINSNMSPVLDAQNVRGSAALIVKRGDVPVQGLSDRLFVRFTGATTHDQIGDLADRYEMTVVRPVRSSGNAVVLRNNAGVSYSLLDTANALLDEPGVEVVEPELLQALEQDQFTPTDPLYSLQTHLPLIDADDGWERIMDFASNLHGGISSICIAVFDLDGVTPNHPDLSGSSKLVTSFDFDSYSAQTVANLNGDHGTQCAGIATARLGNQGTVGIAPTCRLIGALLPNAITGVEMADAFLWAAGIDNGSTEPDFPNLPGQPADVISNSWGSTGTALSTALRDAFDRLTDEGRGGKGCVVTFSTGNLGYVQFSNRRTFAAYNRTIAVGASINTNPTSPVDSSQPDPNGSTTNIAVTVDGRALYSPYGPEMDIVAPSHTCYDGGLVDPTTSTVRVGTGDLDGCAGATTCLDYETSFGGTSHSSPTIAGTAALILSVNPLLTWSEVRDLLRRTAVEIDFGQTNAIGQWTDIDGDGVAEFSQWYGYGRVDVAAAVEEALEMFVANYFS